MKTISLSHSVVALVVTIVVGSHAVTAQNTFTPGPIQTYHSGFWGTDVFADAVPVFALGHQWGAARLDKVNTALKMNVTSQNWGYLNSFAHQMYQLGDGHHDTNFVVWASPLWHTPGPFGGIFRHAWYGLRWEPAEHAWTDRTWEPRDEDSWPFGFQAKHHGTIPTSTADENYRRFVLDTALMSATQVKVLDSVELRNYFRIHRSVNWKKPFEEKFVEYVTGTDTTFHEDSTDGRRWQVVINLRRSDEADTVVDDEPVVSLVVPYHMRWKDQDSTKTGFYQRLRQRMPFRLVPMTSRDSAVALPMDRGLELPMQQPGGGYQDSIVITRRMLPLHSDTGSPDITVVAEFRVDTIWEQRIESGDTTLLRLPHILKSSYFDFPIGPDSTLVDTVAGVVDSTKFNKRYRAIDSLGVTLWYHGNSSVAIRAVSILTPLTKRATSGHYDTAIANRFMVHRDSIKQQIDIVHSHTGRTIRLLAFYSNDEFDVDQLVGMRYKLDLLDRRLTSETGFAGSRRTAGNERSEYGRQKFHGFPSKFLWTSGTSIPSRATAAPYVARRNVNEWSFGTNMPVPSPLMSLKLGYRWADTKAPFRSYETDISTNHFGTWTKISLPFPTSPNYQSIEAYENFIHSDAASVGPATMQEHATYVHMY